MTTTTDNNNKCLVIGGSGFIGSHVVRSLTSKNYFVRVFDRNNELFKKNLGDVENIELVIGDISNFDDVKKALKGIHRVVHSVYTTLPSTSMNNLSYDLDSNISPLINLLELIKESKTVTKLVYLSSGGTVYGNPVNLEPIAEDHPTKPISSYGLTKLIAEHYIRLCLTNSNICGYVLRPSNAYGESQDINRPQGAVVHFLKALLNDLPIDLYGDGGIIRDYIYIKDLTEAIVQCLLIPNHQPGKISSFNVGSEKGVSLSEIINTIENVTSQKLTINHKPSREFDCIYNVLDCTKIKKELNWQTQVSLHDGIKATWKWMQNKNN